MRLTVANLSHRYGKEEILRNINLEVSEGEIVAILGPSGVGKTTLFNLIAGILEVKKGQLILDGENNPKGKVSYMLQKDLLLDHKTVLGNVSLPLRIQGVNKETAEKQALELLRAFNLADVQSAYPRELSGGMRQRIALLRTYLFGPSFFLLDEPFSALDELTKADLHAWYLGIHQSLGLTSLLITHSLDEALTLSNRIYLLNHRPGEIVAEIKLDWQEPEDKEVQKLAYKKEILDYLSKV
ncbi:ABC transporter ATP-binding protein [Streptococcus himalayensis]|uniref:ABC transporter ATP-binding protein n=1 Tax=Streptococcus himalayensis TaxID=1888195 RepID=A0A917A2P7_9STRE|nr:ABC transporter ATP-binding protein [Streptococcus himalayensis]GGE23738.1 ABC transporter ATP-binding protein [Streptococcus himalayensis]